MVTCAIAPEIAAGSPGTDYSVSTQRLPEPPGRWQMLKTPSFRVLHHGRRDLAARVAAAAERLRRELYETWVGAPPIGPWRPRCDLYLYRSLGGLITMTGGDAKAGEAVVRPSQLQPGAILSRRVNLAASDHRLLDSTLPHEITHLVLGDLMAGKVPIWANEGAATLAEGPGKQRYYAAVLQSFVDRRRVYFVDTLVKMLSYPDAPFKGLFYAQSASVVKFFLSLRSRSSFIGFLRFAQAHGYRWALRAVYEIDTFDELHRRWQRFVAQPVDADARTRPPRSAPPPG